MLTAYFLSSDIIPDSRVIDSTLLTRTTRSQIECMTQCAHLIECVSLNVLQLGDGLIWCELNTAAFMDDVVVLIEGHGYSYRDISIRRF